MVVCKSNKQQLLLLVWIKILIKFSEIHMNTCVCIFIQMKTSEYIKTTNIISTGWTIHFLWFFDQ